MPVALQSRDAFVYQLPRRFSGRPSAPAPAAAQLRDVLTTQAVAGRPLHDLLAGSGAVAAVRAAGAALRDLHAQPLPSDAPREGYGPPQEITALTDAMERVIRYAPGMYAGLGERARRVLEHLAELRTPKRRLVHGDLDDTRVRLADDDDTALIDVGGPLAGDPVIDLANLIAHIEETAGETASVLRDALLESYEAPARWKHRLEIYEESARLRLACARAVASDAGVVAALALPT
jgi:aminoglycoside phosphotransferase